MKPKRKIIDVIIFDGNFELLKFRLDTFYNLVHTFIVFDFNENSELEIKKEIFSKWSDKLKLFTNGTENDEKFSLIAKKISEFKLNFEDIVCLSKSDEFPDFTDFDNVVEHLNYSPAVAHQVEFVLNTGIVSTEKHIGSMFFLFTEILRNPKIISSVNNSKEHTINSNFYSVQNGYKFTFFENFSFLTEKLNTNPEKFLDEINQRSIINDLGKKISIMKNTNPFTWDKKLLPETQLELIPSIKPLYILNFYQSFVDRKNILNYSEVYNINFTYDYSFMREDFYENFTNINFFLPPKKLYSNPEDTDFETFFILNEVYNFIKSKSYWENQKLEFIFFFDDWQLSKKIEVNFGDFDWNYFYETFIQHTKKPSI